MIDLKGSGKEQAVRRWFNEKHNGIVPNSKVIDLFKVFKVDIPGISYGCLNSTMKKIVAEGHIDMSDQPTRTGTTESPVPKEPVKAEIITVENMDFPDFGLHRTGKEIDKLFSDYEEDGGQYGGTVTIVVGESGVGKSTVLLDSLASIQNVNPDAKVLYISSEMTKNDIGFYYRKTPAIGKVPTLLLMSHVKDGSINQVLKDEFNKDYDIILLDSYQDVVVKLREVKGWKSTYAESWLTSIMIDAAENNGAAIWAIQHMTKGGQYAGSTYLKHATTAMLELMFDDAGQRYVVFSKNRRGGSAVGKRLYFRLVDGDVVYDANRYKETMELKEIEDAESLRQIDLAQKFEEVFVFGKKDEEEDEAKDAAEAKEESVPLEIVKPSEE